MDLPLEERERACLMKLGVVQDDEARVMEEVRPHVVVTGGVSELEDGEIVRLPAMLPHEIMRAAIRPAVGGSPMRSTNTSMLSSRGRSSGRSRPSMRRCRSGAAAWAKNHASSHGGQVYVAPVIASGVDTCEILHKLNPSPANHHGYARVVATAR